MRPSYASLCTFAPRSQSTSLPLYAVSVTIRTRCRALAAGTVHPPSVCRAPVAFLCCPKNDPFYCTNCVLPVPFACCSQQQTACCKLEPPAGAVSLGASSHRAAGGTAAVGRWPIGVATWHGCTLPRRLPLHVESKQSSGQLCGSANCRSGGASRRLWRLAPSGWAMCRGWGRRGREMGRGMHLKVRTFLDPGPYLKVKNFIILLFYYYYI